MVSREDEYPPPPPPKSYHTLKTLDHDLESSKLRIFGAHFCFHYLPTPAFQLLILKGASLARDSLSCLHSVVLNRLVEEKYEVIWLSENEIYKIKKERMVHMVKKFGEKLGGKGQLYGSLRLIRGYQDPASR